MKTPKAKKIPKMIKTFGDCRKDPYYWMNQRDSKDVLSHIKKEQAYFNSFMKPLETLQKNIFKELKLRIPQKDSSPPYLAKKHFYWSRFEKNKEYPVFCRKKQGEKKSHIILNVNQLAKKHVYYDLSSSSLSFSHRILAFAYDTEGRRFYTIGFKDLKTNTILSQKILNTAGSMVWANDDDTLFYIHQDQTTLRSYQVFKYSLKTGKSHLVFEEKDETFDVHLYKTLSEKYIFIQSSSSMTTESRFVLAHRPDQNFKVFEPRKRRHKYYVEDGENVFYILTNSDRCKNYRLDRASLSRHGFKHWKNILPHNPKVYIEDFDVFENVIALEVRKDGLTEIMLMDRKTKKVSTLPIQKGGHTVGLGVNCNYKTKTLRFEYETMAQPECVYDYNILKGSKKLVKKKKIPGGFDSKKYQCVRETALARDGESIPISLIYKKDQFRKGNPPLYLYGYGSYGYSMEPSFYPHIFSLVDRGFVFAIAHIRGGAEMGKRWHEKGRLLYKKNTFYDFVDCSRSLIQKGWVHPKKLYAGGGSAGGLLMGSIINLAPQLYKAVIAHVPFVDVLTTMQDKSIPLTTGEYDEWGDPGKKKYYDYMKTYSPYDNIRKNKFPHILAASGYHDSQVQYWEPMKWVSRLRDFHQGKSQILLYMDMGTGHSGATGRFQRLKLLAIEYTFLLHLEKVYRRGGKHKP